MTSSNGGRWVVAAQAAALAPARESALPARVTAEPNRNGMGTAVARCPPVFAGVRR